MLDELIIKEIIISADYLFKTDYREKAGYGFPQTHSRRVFLFVWFFYINVVVSFLISKYKGVLKISFILLKKFVKFCYITLLNQVDIEIVKRIKLKKVGCISSIEGKGSKFIYPFIIFFNIWVSGNISICIWCSVEEDRRNRFLFLQK